MGALTIFTFWVFEIRYTALFDSESIKYIIVSIGYIIKNFFGRNFFLGVIYAIKQLGNVPQNQAFNSSA